jgi:hypothetical protein
MWPMVSISLNERLAGNKQKDDEMPKPFAVPLPLLYSALTILAVLLLATWAKTPCGLKSLA